VFIQNGNGTDDGIDRKKNARQRNNSLTLNHKYIYTIRLIQVCQSSSFFFCLFQNNNYKHDELFILNLNHILLF